MEAAGRQCGGACDPRATCRPRSGVSWQESLRFVRHEPLVSEGASIHRDSQPVALARSGMALSANLPGAASQRARVAGKDAESGKTRRDSVLPPAGRTCYGFPCFFSSEEKFVTTATDWATCCTIRLRRNFFPPAKRHKTLAERTNSSRGQASVPRQIAARRQLLSPAPRARRKSR